MTTIYSIKIISQKTGLAISTLHYYEKEGLMPTVARDKNGHRCFTDQDIEWIEFLKCMKQTGMPLQSIRRFANYHKNGGSLGDRREILREHQERMEAQIGELTLAMDFITKKIAMFDRAIDKCPEEV